MSASRMIWAMGLGLGLVLSGGSFAVGQTVRFVDDDGPAGGDGLSWQTAYRFLQDALFEARGDSTITEIRVRQGRYTPDRDEGGHVTPGDREASFELVNGVAVRGGFRGLDAGLDSDDRDIEVFQTILSGDLEGNDIVSNCCFANGGPGCDDLGCQQDICAVFPRCCEEWDDDCAQFAHHTFFYPCRLPCVDRRLGENSLHVIVGNGLDESAILEGFTITGGNADGRDPDTIGGGGMFNMGASPTVRQCVFSRNFGGMGAGLFNFEESAPAISDCMFVGNEGGFGGAICNDSSSPIVRNCWFVDNLAIRGGGALCNEAGSGGTIEACVFIRNESSEGSGGAVRNARSSAEVLKCVFEGNSAHGMGGAVFNRGENLRIIGCTFTANTSNSNRGGGVSNTRAGGVVADCVFVENVAESGGGGMSNTNGSIPTVTNCIFSGNESKHGGGGIENVGENAPLIVNCSFQGNKAESGRGGGMLSHFGSRPIVINCVFWGNTDRNGATMDASLQIDDRFDAVTTVTYTCIQDNDPDDDSIPFGGEANGNIDDDPLFADPLGPDGVAGTEDDDLRLMAGSPCIDAGDNGAVPADAFDLDGDGDVDEPVPLDLDDLPRFVDDRRTDDTGLGECRIVDMGAFEFQGRMVPPQVVVLCHAVGGDAAEGRTIFVPEEAVEGHLAHGDVLGPCNGCGMRLMGDVNGDGALDGNDVSSFVDLLLGRPGNAQVLQPGGPDDATAFQNEAADVNADGVIDMADIGAMVECVLQGGC